MAEFLQNELWHGILYNPSSDSATNLKPIDECIYIHIYILNNKFSSATNRLFLYITNVVDLTTVNLLYL